MSKEVKIVLAGIMLIQGFVARFWPDGGGDIMTVGEAKILVAIYVVGALVMLSSIKPS